MSRPSYTEAASFANRSDNIGTSLKTPHEGGPMWKRYGIGANTYHQSDEFKRDHPRYPDYVYPDDKARDTYYEAKQALAETMPTGLVMASEKDINYVMDKKNAQELALFKQFVEDSIPRGTPWAKDFFERIMPGWYQSKIDIIQDKLAIINRFIDITIRGPQNIEDMFLLYQIYTGKFDLPTNFSDVIRPNDQRVNDGDFASGLFNPKKRITQQIIMSRANQEKMANFAIPGIDFKGLLGGNRNNGYAIEPTGYQNVDEVEPRHSAATRYTQLLNPANENFFGSQLVNKTLGGQAGVLRRGYAQRGNANAAADTFF